MAEFLKNWDEIINNMLDHYVLTSQKMVFGCFLAVWRTPTKLQWSVKHMLEASPGDKDCSYRYMRGTIVKYLQSTQESRIDEERAKEVRNAGKGGGGPAGPALGDGGKKEKAPPAKKNGQAPPQAAGEMNTDGSMKLTMDNLTQCFTKALAPMAKAMALAVVPGKGKGKDKGKHWTPESPGSTWEKGTEGKGGKGGETVLGTHVCSS